MLRVDSCDRVTSPTMKNFAGPLECTSLIYPPFWDVVVRADWNIVEILYNLYCAIFPPGHIDKLNTLLFKFQNVFINS
jgi:hypothetical protein